MALAQRCRIGLKPLPSRQHLLCMNIKTRPWVHNLDTRTFVVSERLSGSQGSYEEEEDRPRTATSSAASSSNQTNAGHKPLFDSAHVPKWTLPLLLYLPFGVLLAITRMILWIGGILLDASWFRGRGVVSTYLKLLGFRAKWRNLHLIPQGYHVLVSNHTTSGDLMCLFELPQRYTHLITTAMPARVMATRNLPVVLRPATPEMYDELARRVQSASSTGSTGSTSSMSSVQEEDELTGSTAPAAATAGTTTYAATSSGNGSSSSYGSSYGSSSGSSGTHVDAPPVHLFPEGGLTNGSGMLQFSRGFMKFVPPGTPVVPVALRARTPFGIRTHTLTSSFLANLFWFSFCPWVEMEAVVLPPMTQAEGEGRGAFVQRVQGVIASELGVQISEVTIQQKRALMRAAEAARKTKASSSDRGGAGGRRARAAPA